MNPYWVLGSVVTPAAVVHAAIAGLVAAVFSAAPAYAQTDNVFSIAGIMTDEGIECPALRGDDGTLYTLMPEAAVAGFAAGDRLTVRGTAADASFCGQGATIEITTVELEGETGAPPEMSAPDPSQ